MRDESLSEGWRHLENLRLPFKRLALEKCTLIIHFNKEQTPLWAPPLSLHDDDFSAPSTFKRPPPLSFSPEDLSAAKQNKHPPPDKPLKTNTVPLERTHNSQSLGRASQQTEESESTSHHSTVGSWGCIQNPDEEDPRKAATHRSQRRGWESLRAERFEGRVG